MLTLDQEKFLRVLLLYLSFSLAGYLKPVTFFLSCYPETGKPLVRFQTLIMYYKSIQIFKILGLSPILDGDVFTLTDNADISMSAVFCANVDAHCAEIDRKNVIANLILGGPWGLDDEAQLAVIKRQIEILQSERKNHSQNFANVVLEVLVEFDVPELKYIRKFKGFVVSLDEIPVAGKEKLRLASSHAKNLLLSSLFLSSENPIEIHEITEGSYLIDCENNFIYNYNPSLSAKAYTLQKVNEQLVIDTKKYLNILGKSQEFSKVCRLLSQAIDEKNDNFRSFLFAWIALEIFINKVFKEYELKFTSELVKNCDLKTKDAYLARVSNVMKDKYRLLDKFVVVSAYFADENVDELIDKFQNIKKTRDKIFHGDEVNDDSLPFYEIVELFRNYFKKHLLEKIT